MKFTFYAQLTVFLGNTKYIFYRVHRLRDRIQSFRRNHQYTISRRSMTFPPLIVHRYSTGLIRLIAITENWMMAFGKKYINNELVPES